MGLADKPSGYIYGGDIRGKGTRLSEVQLACRTEMIRFFLLSSVLFGSSAEVILALVESATTVTTPIVRGGFTAMLILCSSLII